MPKDFIDLINPRSQEIKEAGIHIFKEKYISQEDINLFSKKKAVFNRNIYNKAKYSDDHLAEILDKLDDFTLIELDSITIQMRRSRILNINKEDKEVEHASDILFVMAQIVPALGLISGALTLTNIFLVPLIIMLYSLLYLTNNIKVDGFFNTKNIWLFLTFFISIATSIFALSVYTGAYYPFSPIIIPLILTLNTIIFIYATYREIVRDKNANDYAKIKVTKVADKYYSILPRAESAIKNISNEIKKSLFNEREASLDDDIMITKLNILRFFMHSLLREYCNNVRTIKSPITKINHLHTLANIKTIVATTIIKQELESLKISPPLEVEQNIKNYTQGKNDPELVRFLEENNLNHKKFRNNYIKSDVYQELELASKKVKKYLYRDIPCYIFNIALISISILIAIPFIPITLSAVTMISIASIVATFTFINLSLRIKDYFYPERTSNLFKEIEILHGLRIKQEHNNSMEQGVSRVWLVEAEPPKTNKKNI